MLTQLSKRPTFPLFGLALVIGCARTDGHPRCGGGADDRRTRPREPGRRAAAGDVHATHTLLQVLHDLALRLGPGTRSQAIYQQLTEVRYQIAHHTFSPTDKGVLNQMADQVEQARYA